ncbi:hypothetical protein HZR84_14130 [Hyphobacterium sp. CCMP332]|nr:hypothetical protein HZR84_14130 [Hyphobacterium sp. CCMP332]
MRFLAIVLFVQLLSISLHSCNIDDKYRWRNRAVKHYDDYIPYDLLRPVAEMKLHNDLIEISGLTHIGDNKIACVEDETGNIYILDDESGKMLEKIKFHKYGDYEGIEKIGEDFYIAKSNGKLYKWSRNKLEKLKTELGVENNIEGMCYDPFNDLIYLACKELAGLNEDEYDNARAVYAYDYKMDSLIIKPRFIIYQDTLMNYVYNTWSTGEEIPNILFKPSGIAVHPFDERIYIVNYIGRIIIVLNQDASIHAVLPLSIQLFSQPEGICFDSDGNLYISNEGGEEKGYILKFKHRPAD